MSTFITGVCGFVGLALAEHLLERGESVVGVDLREPPRAAAAAFAELPGRFTFERCDVTDAARIHAIMRRHAASRLVTMAAITADAARERRSPDLIAAVNIGGVWNAVSAAAACGIQRVVHASSGSVYGASGEHVRQLDEDSTPLRPDGLYGITKQAAEAGALRIASLHGLDLTIARLGTCFGPWESDTGVRDTLSAPLQVLVHAECGRTALLPRPGLRDWLYVRDAAASLAALLAQRKLPRSTYNVAAGFTWSVLDWCRQLQPAFPTWSGRLASQGEVPNVDYYAPYDRSPMAIHRLLQDTPFVPRFDLAAAVQDFGQWRLRHASLPSTPELNP